MNKHVPITDLGLILGASLVFGTWQHNVSAAIFMATVLLLWRVKDIS